MKKRNFSTPAVLLILSFGIFSCSENPKGTNETSGKIEGTVSISGAFALYPIANIWAEEFTKLHPDVKFNISAGGAGKGVADALAQTVDLGMLSRDLKEEEKAKGGWIIAVTKDAVLPTISSNNPYIDILKEKGLTKELFRKIFITGEIKTWGEAIAENSKKETINVFTRSDAAGAAETWAKYLGAKGQEEIKGIGVFGDPGVAEAVKKDPTAIGFNNVIYVYDIKTKSKYEGIDVVPIDINGDGKIEDTEKFYDDIDQITSAIADGRYPSPPARELYFISKGKPTNIATVEFLKWVLSDGQKFIDAAGYIKLPAEKITTEVQRLN
jgi:phosphate transport system substrate-binding protein